MNLDELQSVQSKERQASDLQHLRPSFYADAAEFIQELREQRQRVVTDEGLDAPEFERLTDDIKTAERAVESIYERRVGKVVKKASIAAADMPTDEEGLTEEERDLFETLVAEIRTNREQILSTLDDDAGAPATGGASGPATADDSGRPAGTDPPTGRSADAGRSADRPEGPTAGRSDDPAGEGPEPADAAGAGRVDAADLMGGDGADDAPAPASPDGAGRPDPDPVADRDAPPDPDPAADPVQSPDSGGAPAGAPDAGPDAGSPDDPGGGSDAGSTSTGDAGSGSASTGDAGDGSDVDRTTVRITRDVGEILGVDQRAYHLASEDVVTLPETNAEPLVERGAAERIE